MTTDENGRPWGNLLTIRKKGDIQGKSGGLRETPRKEKGRRPQRHQYVKLLYGVGAKKGALVLVGISFNQLSLEGRQSRKNPRRDKYKKSGGGGGGGSVNEIYMQRPWGQGKVARKKSLGQANSSRREKTYPRQGY